MRTAEAALDEAKRFFREEVAPRAQEIDSDPVAIGEVLRGLCERELMALPARFFGLSVDEHIVMPDHLHAIVMLCNTPVTLPRIMQAFKSLSTARCGQQSFSLARMTNLTLPM